MTRAELARLIDHSVLKPEATEDDVRAGADVVRTLQIGFYCVQPFWVKLAAEAIDGPTASKAAALARELKVHLIFCFTEQRAKSIW